ncbi:MAG: OmpA family protein [Chitinophagales bacterium]
MKKIFTLLFMTCIFSLTFAQVDFALKDSSHLKEKHYDNQYAYEVFESSFAPKKKNNWAIGFDIGMPVIHGDVKYPQMLSGGASFKIRKGFNHFFSLRWQSLFARARGMNSTSFDYNGIETFGNYETHITDHTIQGVFSLGNVNYHKRKSKLIFNIFIGTGVSTVFNRMNLLDENGTAYDFSAFNDPSSLENRKQNRKDVKELLDDSYETIVEPTNAAHIKDTRILPTLVIGAGLDFKVSKRVDLALEYRMSKHFTDYLDGVKTETATDKMSYLSMGLNFKIGKNDEPTYWTNPLISDYDNMAQMRKDVTPSQIEEMLERKLDSLDTDGDGVLDKFDVEVATPRGASVDAKGRAIDSDKDGVPDIYDIEPDTEPGAQVDVVGRTIVVESTNSSANQEEIWHVFFESGSYKVASSYSDVLLNVVSYAASHPTKSILISGHTDPRSSDDFNMELSQMRATEVKKELEELGIPRDRMETRFFGEKELFVDLPENDNSAKQKLNRRVTISIY